MKRRKRRRMWLLLIVLGLFVLLPATPSCNTPFGTVAVEDEMGQKIGLAWDKNPLDGVADIDPATGRTDYVLPESAYAVAQQVDEIAPMLLKGAGSLLGVSLLTLLGVFWKNRKLARVGVNVVESVQAARYAVSKDGPGGLLRVLDKALGGAQTGETRAAVRKIKEKNVVASVTTKAAAEVE